MFVAKVATPPLASPKYYKRTVTLVVPMETKAFGCMAPIGPIPSPSRGHGGKELRPFTLENLEAPRRFLGQGKPVGSPWLASMLY